MRVTRTVLPALALLVALMAHLAQAQFQITGSSPANGSANLPDDLEICLTFNADLDTTQQYVYNGHEDILLPVGVLIAEPESALSPPAWEWNGTTRTLCISISATANEDYYFLFAGARSDAGQELEAPFELHLSTRSGNGELTVAGTVARSDGESPAGAVVALFEGYPMGPEDAILRAGALVGGPSGEYTIPFVRPGVYYPVTAMDSNGDSNIDPQDGDLFGFYDPNQDGAPDSLVVGPGGVEGLQLVLGDLPALSARGWMSEALAAAQGAYQVDDAVLKVISSVGETIRDDGACLGWAYLFSSATLQTWIRVIHMGGMTSVDTFQVGWQGMLDLPATFIDSGQALAIALANGGSEVELNLANPTRYALVGNFRHLGWHDPNLFFWTVHVVGWTDLGEWLDHLFIIDAVSGQFLTGYQTDLSPERPLAHPQSPNLGTPWPNPFNPSLRIPFELDHAQDLRLAVYNLDGQLVIELARGAWAAGHHELIFDGSPLASGLYLVVLEAEGRCEARKIALMK